jgi:hypothetical protein
MMPLNASKCSLPTKHNAEAEFQRRCLLGVNASLSHCSAYAEGAYVDERAPDASLTKFGITHTFETFEGDHSNHLHNRIEDKVLPFFSASLPSASRSAENNRGKEGARRIVPASDPLAALSYLRKRTSKTAAWCEDRR